MPNKKGGKRTSGADLQPSAQTLAALGELALEWNCSRCDALERAVYHSKSSLAHAYHEAGHAVIALEFGLELKSIEITKVKCPHPSELPARLQLMVAGMIAQRKADVPEAYIAISGKLDQAKCEQVIAEDGLSKKQGIAAMESARKAVEDLFEKKYIWSAVRRVAARLFEFWEMSPMEAAKVFEEERTKVEE